MLLPVAGEIGALAKIFLAGCELSCKHHAPAAVAHVWSVLPFHTPDTSNAPRGRSPRDLGPVTVVAMQQDLPALSIVADGSQSRIVWHECCSEPVLHQVGTTFSVVQLMVHPPALLAFLLETVGSRCLWDVPVTRVDQEDDHLQCLPRCWFKIDAGGAYFSFVVDFRQPMCVHCVHSVFRFV
jgi:hypothetical protein